jgi:hypothetical protein
MHHMERYRWNKAWKNEVRLTFLPHRLKFPARSLPLNRPQIVVTFFTIHLLDQDNFRQAAEPMIDSLKERGGIGLIRDHGPEFIPEPVYLPERVAHRNQERVQIALEASECGSSVCRGG